jgi:hypothetical protein
MKWFAKLFRGWPSGHRTGNHQLPASPRRRGPGKRLAQTSPFFKNLKLNFDTLEDRLAPASLVNTLYPPVGGGWTRIATATDSSFQVVGASGRGAYVYSAATGALVATLADPSPGSGDGFGYSVSVSGNTVVVGAAWDDAGAQDSGQAYVFNATTGALIATLANASPASRDGFGVSVSVSGNTVAVGGGHGPTNSGQACVFNATTGALIATLDQPSPGSGDGFGFSVSMSGNTVVVGAPWDDRGATDSGEAYVFNATTGALIATLANPAPASSDQFGLSVSVSGNTVVVGAASGAQDSGQAYVFNATTGALIAALANPSPASSDGLFGFSVSVSGNIVAVLDVGGPAYVYSLDSGPGVVTIAVTPASIPSGGTATVTLTVKDATGKPLTGLPISFGWSASGFFPTGSGSFSSVTDNNDGSYTATFTGTSAGPVTITAALSGQPITSTLPTIIITPAATKYVFTNLSPTSVAAGGIVTFTVTAQDSSGNTATGYTGTVHLTSTDGHAAAGGDGLPASYTFLASDNGAHTFTVTLATAGSQTITVTDQANNSLTATTSPITVIAGPVSQFLVNAASGNTIMAGGPFLFSVQAGDSFGNPVTSYGGPTSITAAARPPDPQASSPITGMLNGSGFGSFLVDLKTAGSYTVTTTAGSFTGTSAGVTVTPSDAYYFTVAAPAAATTDSPINVVVKAFDHFGNLATGYKGQIHLTSSDGSAILPADSTLTGGAGTFSVALKTAGSQTISATDSLSTNPTITGTSSAITTRGLTVTSITPTVNGFTANFSKAFVPGDITLYGSGATVQDVTLVGAASGPIPGTLIIDPSNSSITFHATASSLAFFNNGAPILADDTYTVTLVSAAGAGGFHDTLNAGLDGANNSGHANYTTTFTTHYHANPIPVLSIPDFARGPDDNQPIKVSNDTGHGIPITLYNASNLTEAVFSVTYNPTLLDISDVSNADATDPTGNLMFSSTKLGVATFEYTGVTPENGTVVLGDIIATVPKSAAANYKAKELIQVAPLEINNADAINGNDAGASAIHVNAYYGDVTGNGTIDGLDVATEATVASGTATGFAAYSLLDPALIGDPASDISVDAGDVSTLAAYTAHLPTPQIPAIPSGLTITPVGPDPTLSLGAAQRQGDKEKGRQGETPTSPGLLVSLSPSLLITVSVMLDDPHPDGSTGMTEAILAMNYDPSRLSVAAITLGSIPNRGTGWQLSYVVDQATGRIGIELYSPTPITQAEAGSLVNITFRITDGEPSGVSRRSLGAQVQLASSLIISGQEFTTQVDDAQGQYVLSAGTSNVVLPVGIGPKGAQILYGARSRLLNRREM